MAIYRWAQCDQCGAMRCLYQAPLDAAYSHLASEGWDVTASSLILCNKCKRWSGQGRWFKISEQINLSVRQAEDILVQHHGVNPAIVDGESALSMLYEAAVDDDMEMEMNPVVMTFLREMSARGRNSFKKEWEDRRQKYEGFKNQWTGME